MGPAFGEVPGALAWIGTAIGVVGYFSVAVADALVIEAMRRLSLAASRAAISRKLSRRRISPFCLLEMRLNARFETCLFLLMDF